MAGFLLSGFILTTRSVNLSFRSAPLPGVAQGSHSNPAAFPPGSATQPRLIESYGRLPLSFEINQGQTDPTVKFLSRGSGYSLFLTGNEAVLALKKPMTNSQSPMAEGVAEGFPRPRRDGAPFNAVVFRVAQRSLFNAASSPTKRSPAPELSPAPFDGALFPNLFPSSAGESYRNGAVDTNCERKDLEKPQGLKGEPCAAPARIPSPESLAPAVLRMKLVGASPHAQVSGLEELPGKSNYFIGNDPKKWRTNVPNYAKVKYANVYPGVDLVYYGNQGRLEYDFVVAPGGDPRSIQLGIVSDEQGGGRQKAVGSETDVGAGLAPPERAPQTVPLQINATGDLVVGTDGGEVIFHKPVVYQSEDNRPMQSTKDKGQLTKDGGKDYVDGRYVLRSDNSVGFQVASYDPAKPLVIDPVLAYSTYLGGSGYNVGYNIAVDGFGNAYLTGQTLSNFPTTPGAFQTTFSDTWDAFVSKVNPTGSALVYSTFLGAGGAGGITVDPSGNAYVVGSASGGFPITPGALQSTCTAGCAFVSKLNPAGSALAYSTFLGGSSYDFGGGIAVDASGNAYVAGFAQSSDFPTTPGAFQTTNGGGADAFVSKLNPAGSALIYSTYLGGSSLDDNGGIAVDASGDAYVTGETSSTDFPTTPGAFQTTYGGGPCQGDFACGDKYVSKLNATGSALIYSTYLGGSGADWGSGIAIDGMGNAYVTGETESPDFPITPGAFQTTSKGGGNAFVSKLNATGSALIYSTYLGGSDTDRGNGIAVDASGNAYVAGTTSSADFPSTPDAFQATYGGDVDTFLSKLKGDGSSLLYSTYLGGSGGDTSAAFAIAIDASGNAYVTGSTQVRY